MTARIALSVLLGALFVAALFVAVRGPDRPLEAPDFVLPDLDGSAVRMRDLRGKVVVLNLWATWCPPCVEEMPTLERLHRRMQGQDFMLLAVSQDESPDVVAPWIREHGFTFPVLLDPRGEVGHALGATGYPETFVVDRQGRIVHHHVGFRDWMEPAILDALLRLLGTGEWGP
ncbi:MAG: TlpA disulfide reductase family protein [Candidatus Binatia bacterium]